MSLVSGFLHQRTENPRRVAFFQDERILTYGELDDRARALAAALAQRLIQAGDGVAVALERGIDSVVCIYGILYLGACYLPLDIRNPGSRLHGIVQDAGVRAVIGAGNRPNWMRGDVEWLDWAQLALSGGSFVPCRADPEALAAILYTSGSGGKPKGIALSHRAMTAFADWAGAVFTIGCEDRIASLAPFYFDLSVFDLFTSMRHGAAVDFIPGSLTLTPARLSAWLDARAITCWYTVPSVLGFLVFKGQLAQRPLNKLTRVLFAGEVFPTPQLIQLAQLLPHVDFFNLYGPTETNVCCYWFVDRSRLSRAQPMPIGVPACSAQLRIDEENDELLVKGPSLMSGYWKNGCLEKALDERTWYRTGDRASRNEKGEFLYHGRLDRMLKCSGYRVEPAEIEASISRFPGVEDCAVVGVVDAVGAQRPVAAIVLDAEADVSCLMLVLKRQLPVYMLPARMVFFDRLPCFSNGKVDYQSLEKALRSKPV